VEPWLTFSVLGTTYAVPLGVVDGVDPRGAVARVPAAPAHVRGVFGRRGTVLPVLDLALLLGQPSGAAPSGEWLVVVRDGDRWAGIEVDGLPSVIERDHPTDEEMAEHAPVLLDVASLLTAAEVAVAAP
jgi:purine-binding chemotaxis protein CheW